MKVWAVHRPWDRLRIGPQRDVLSIQGWGCFSEDKERSAEFLASQGGVVMHSWSHWISRRACDPTIDVMAKVVLSVQVILLGVRPTEPFVDPEGGCFPDQWYQAQVSTPQPSLANKPKACMEASQVTRHQAIRSDDTRGCETTKQDANNPRWIALTLGVACRWWTMNQPLPVSAWSSLMNNSAGVILILELGSRTRILPG